MLEPKMSWGTERRCLHSFAARADKLPSKLVLSVGLILFICVLNTSGTPVRSTRAEPEQRSADNSEIISKPSSSLSVPENQFPPLNVDSPLYLAKLAYAKKLVRCFTLGVNQIPSLDKLTHLITEAQCLTPECYHCLKKTQECELKRGKQTSGPGWVSWESLNQGALCNETTETPFKNSAPLAYSASPTPSFHCYRPKTNSSFDAYYRIEYRSITTGESPWETEDSIPRLFVVEKANSNENVSVVVTTSWLIHLEDVLPGKYYSLSVTPVSPGKVHPKSVVPPRRFPATSEREERKPKDVTVDFDLKSVGTNATSLLIRWTSGAGENASCESNVFILDNDDEEFGLQERKEPTKAFWMTITKKLNFAKNYSVVILEKFGGKEFGQQIFAIQVPSCYSIYNNSLKQCAPQKVSKLVITHTGEHGLLVTWEAPAHSSKTNPVINYNLTVSQTELFATRSGSNPGGIAALHDIQKIVFTTLIRGNETSFKVWSKNITRHAKIQVSIQAFSEGGASEVAIAKFEFPPYDAGGLYEKIWIPILVVISLFLIVIGLMWLKYYRDKLKRKKQLHEYFDKLDKESIQLDPTVDRFTSKWEIHSGALVLGDVIGEGAFGLVRKAMLYKDGHKLLVAVKTLRDGIDEKDSGKFWEEFNILKNLDPHKHVVGLVGIVKAHVPALVVEYCHGGDLQTHLRRASQLRAMQNGGSRHSKSTSSTASTSTYESTHSHNESRVRMSMVINETYFCKRGDPVETVSELDLLSYARQIACGMEFLSSNKIVHRDLAARNVLIGQNRTLKIADFGLSRDVYEQNWYKKNSDGKIPIKWLAIECLLQEVYTTKSDVWSYGILLWEIVTFGGNPYPGIENTRMFDLLKSGYRMSQPENCSKELYDLMSQCWSEKPVDRPDFASVRRKLDDIIEKSNLVVYMNLAHDSSNSASSLESDSEE